MATKRKATQMASAMDDIPVDPSEELVFTGLGGCNEVGRSCHIIQYKGKTIMLDAGMYSGRDGIAALPYFDEFDLSAIDVLLISHFHLDHTAALPYVLAKTNFRGRVFMTHPTKAIYKWLIQDSVRVSNTSSTSDQRTSLYTEQDHISTLPQIETIDFYTTHTVSGIRVTPYPAGHVLGAAMFVINIAGLNVFFTGDYSREPDRHLIAAEKPKDAGKIDVMITESTFGISNAPPRAERETSLMKSVTGILNRGGKVLMPVFALGRAQELLLILEDYWQRHPEFQKIPVYYTGNTARKCMVIYQTYINAMNDNIRRIFRERMAEAEASGNAKGVSSGPWDFRFVRSLRNLDKFEDVGGCVMLASPGMLQSGMSRMLLERWAPDPRNGVIMTGYNVEGTMARIILQEPESIPAITSGASGGGSGGGAGAGYGMSRRNKDGSENQVMIPRRCSVDEFSFAAHVTGVENVGFVEEIGAPHVILVHGEKAQMTRLRSKLLSLNNTKSTNVKVYSPQNAEEVRIPFRKDKTAKVVGNLAQIAPPVESANPGDPGASSGEGRVVSGVLVQNGFKLSLMAPEDLREYAGLTTTTIMCKQHITLGAAGVELIKWALESTFGAVEEVAEKSKGGEQEPRNGYSSEPNGQPESIPNGHHTDQETAEDYRVEQANGKTRPSESSAQSMLVMGCVTVTWLGHHGQLELEWEGNVMNDGIADAVMAVLLTVESSPAAVKYSSSRNSHHHHHDHHKHEDGSELINGEKYGDESEDKNNEKLENKHANASVTPEERFARLCMFLEEQFGQDIIPIERPKIDLNAIKSRAEKEKILKQEPNTGNRDDDNDDDDEQSQEDANKVVKHDEEEETGLSENKQQSEDESEDDEQDIESLEQIELARLVALGIPVPGLEIRVDKHVAKLWLENLEVECDNSVLRDRIKAVVERAVETIAPLWKVRAGHGLARR